MNSKLERLLVIAGVAASLGNCNYQTTAVLDIGVSRHHLGLIEGPLTLLGPS